MRPSFSYFDKSDLRTKAEKKAENEADLDEEEAKQVTVQFARTENDNSRKAREKSFTYLAQKGADEGWCETKWFTKDSPQAVLEREKLFGVTNQPLSKPNIYIWLSQFAVFVFNTNFQCSQQPESRERGIYRLPYFERRRRGQCECVAFQHCSLYGKTTPKSVARSTADYSYGW